MSKWILIALLALPFAVSATEHEIDCDNAMTTMDINHCAYLELESAQAELLAYLEASFEHNSDDPELIDAIKLAQQNWEAYKTSHCTSIYTQWREGTIRSVMAISCETRLTQQRTHEIWLNFLTYMDSTEPVLPEPRVFSEDSD